MFIMKTASKNLLSFDTSEEALNHSLHRGFFGSVWDVLVLFFSTISIIFTWLYHTTFSATKESKDDTQQTKRITLSE
jgi:membrane protein implicated in regulation of membrane protease activity